MPQTNSPGPVPQDALNFFRAKGYKVGFDYRDVWKEEHANAFTVAKAMDIDLLSDIKSAIDSAIVEGKTLRQFQKELTPLLAKKGWWGEKEMLDPKTGEIRSVQLGSPRRLKTIYATNMRTARAAGQWDRAQRTKKFSPYFRYSLGPSQHHRDKHVAWAGMILPVDDPFWDTHYPPNGWGCKCRVRQISAREAKKYGGLSKSPRLTYKIWENVRTGKKEQIPVGIDPGWNHHHGKNRSSNLTSVLAAKEATFKKSAATPLPKKQTGNNKAVSEALDIKPSRGKVKNAANNALALIDKVHRDGELPKIPLVSKSNNSYYGAYVYYPSLGGRPKNIEINPRGVHIEMTVMHEVGHFLDQQVLGDRGRHASSDNPKFAGFRKAVQKSNAIKELKKKLDNATSYKERKDLNYYLSTHEIWARAYAQYIATKSKDPNVLAQLDKMRSLSNKPIQWADDDFKDISNEIDNIFKDKDWLK